MFDELEKYNQQNHFFLKRHDSLKEVCHAPTNKSGNSDFIAYLKLAGNMQESTWKHMRTVELTWTYRGVDVELTWSVDGVVRSEQEP